MKKEEKQEYNKIKDLKRSEKILNNTPLETIKMLKTLSKETLIKPKIQNGIPIVSNYKKVYEEQRKSEKEGIYKSRVYKIF